MNNKKENFQESSPSSPPTLNKLQLSGLEHVDDDLIYIKLFWNSPNIKGSDYSLSCFNIYYYQIDSPSLINFIRYPNSNKIKPCEPDICDKEFHQIIIYKSDSKLILKNNNLQFTKSELEMDKDYEFFINYKVKDSNDNEYTSPESNKIILRLSHDDVHDLTEDELNNEHEITVADLTKHASNLGPLSTATNQKYENINTAYRKLLSIGKTAGLIDFSNSDKKEYNNVDNCNLTFDIKLKE